MTLNQIRQKYLDYMKNKGHQIIPSSSLVPENDPTTLFTTAGMQPMINYLLGEKHPQGTRIADSQKCFRAEDIDKVGDNRHTTFFEMLGNWSLGDYWKKEQLEWIFTFLTDEIGLDPQRLYVTVFSGDKKNNIPKDNEAIEIWQQLFKSKNIEATAIDLVNEEQGYNLGMQGGRIFSYDAEKNWWSRAGVPNNMPAGEPGGPDSEIFYEFTHIEHDSKYGAQCHPNCDCGRFMEIGNSVFMAYQKQKDGTFIELPNKNIDFGGGLERIAAAINQNPDVFEIDVFKSIIESITANANISYNDDTRQNIRIIADHLRAAVFLVHTGIYPSNKKQGYILRRLLRQAVMSARNMSQDVDTHTLFEQVINQIIIYYQDVYFDATDSPKIIGPIMDEIAKFKKTLNRGLAQLEAIMHKKFNQTFISPKEAFDLYQSYGLPIDVVIEEAKKRNVDGTEIKSLQQDFDIELQKHQQQSRTASAGMFKGGLADHSETITQYHTTTHILHKALRDTLGDHVQQMGSNITNERLRFDFKHPQALTKEELQKVETIINDVIKKDLPVHKTIEDKNAALESGALAFFREKYPDKVSVYTIGNDPQNDWYSKELCGGPHVSSTGQIPPVTIKKEQSVGAGVRRIYIVFNQ